MKEWFFNLEDDKKKWVHIVLIGLWFLLPVLAPEEGENTFLSLLWFAVNVFEIIFIVYHRQYNKEKKTKSTRNSTYQRTTTSTNKSVDVPKVEYKKRTVLDQVKVLDKDEVKMIAGYYRVTDGKNCLVYDHDGKYHTNVGCYLNWPQEKQMAFVEKGWRAISIEEAESKGYEECLFCKENSLSDEERFNRMLRKNEYLEFKAVRTGSAKVQDGIQMLEEGVRLNICMDYDSSEMDYYLCEMNDIDGESRGYIPRSITEKLEFIPDNAYCFVKELKEKPNGNFDLICYIDTYFHKNMPYEDAEEEKVNESKVEQITHAVETKNNNCVESFKGQSITFIDLETPNLNNNSICQIGIINYTEGNLMYKENLLINPEAKFDNKNMQIHGITPMMVEKAPTFAKVWPNISQYFINSIIVGHGVHFDINVIDKTLANYGLKLNSLSYIDTQKVAQHNMQSDKYTLSALCDKLGIETQKAHDALSDCKDCMNLLIKLIEKYSVNLTHEKEEYFPKNEVSENKSYVNINYSKESLSYQYVQSLLNKILEDETVDESELKLFAESVEKLNLKETYPISKAYEIAVQKLNGDTTLDVKQAMETVTGNIKSNGFDGVFEGKIFCLTGDFNHGSKNDVKAYLESKGAIVSDTINMKVNYLVRGSQGSDAYAYGNYGGKVKRAMEMQEKGKDVRIIDEEDIY